MAKRTDSGWNDSKTGDLAASEQARKARETLNETPNSAGASHDDDKSRVVLHYGEDADPEGFARADSSKAGSTATEFDAVDAPSFNGIAMCHGGGVTATREKGSTHE